MSELESIGSRRSGGSSRGKLSRLFGPSKKDDPLPEPADPFNPAEDIHEKREWARRNASGRTLSPSSASADSTPRLFEHFCIVGLPPTMNIKAVSADIRTYHTARRAGGAGMDAIVPETESNAKQYGIKGPALPAEVLATFPGSHALADDLAQNLAAFCFPQGVRPELLERTPSMSALNEVVFGQPYQSQADHSFVFLMQVADPDDPVPKPLYGVCCYARELVHRPPSMARSRFPDATAPLARYMVAAQRCYCLLTRHPFFELHFRVLGTVLGLERLDRMSAFAGEVELGLVHGGRQSTVDGVTEGAPQAQAGNKAKWVEHSSSSITDSESITTEASSGGPGDGFANPASGMPDSQEVEGPLQMSQPRSMRGLSGLHRAATTSSVGRAATTSSVHRAATTSSVGSDLDSCTPSAPLLPPTPFFTPAPNAVATGSLLGFSRRVTHYHGDADADASSSPEPMHADAKALVQRIDTVKQLLEDSLIELEARLEPSPPFLGHESGGGQGMAEGTMLGSGGEDEGERLLLDLGGGGGTPQLQRQQLSGDDATAASDMDSFATAVQSSRMLSDSSIGEWVGAEDSDSSVAASNAVAVASTAAAPPSQQQQQQQPQSSDNGVNQTLEDLLRLKITVEGAPSGSPRSQHHQREIGEGGGEEDAGSALSAVEGQFSGTLEATDVLQQYLATAVPGPGGAVCFQPNAGLQPVKYRRPHAAAALEALGMHPDASAPPDIDAAENLGAWAVAALCRALSIDSILSFLAATLLERQVVLFCPNVGLLCGVALSLIPMLLPFSWQSLLLPILPASRSRLELLEAPVPFVVGVMYKTQEVRAVCGNLVRVNVYKDRVRNAGSLPTLPQAAKLATALAGPHAELRRLGRERAADTRPVHEVDERQTEASRKFLAAMQAYLQGLVADLKGYALTDVSEGDQRVSVLLKESFLDSFAPRDRAFMRQFVETQMFSVYCDSVL